MSGGHFMSANKLMHKMQCAQKELDRKKHVNYMKLAYGRGEDNVVKPFHESIESIPALNLSEKKAKKLEDKHKIFDKFSKLGKLENFFTYHGKKYVSPYKGMQVPPSKHVQKKIHVLAKEKRLGKYYMLIMILVMLLLVPFLTN